MTTKEQVHARHGVVTDPLADEPFWRRPLPPIPGRTAGADDPLADDSDPLADTLSLENFAPPHASKTAPPSSAPAPIAPQPNNIETHPVVSFRPEAAAEPEHAPVMSASPASSPTLSVAELQRVLVDSQLKMADAIEQQKECRGHVNVARAAFQQVTSAVTTPAQLIRQHLLSEQARRKERVERGGDPQAPTRRLGSAVDQYAYYTRAQGRQAGGGRAFTRKGYPAWMRNQLIIPKGE